MDAERRARLEAVVDVLQDALDGYGDPSEWANIIVTRLDALDALHAKMKETLL